MATISSPGIGSGLDVQGIVRQLVALEKAPLKQLQTQASSFQTKLSTYGTIKSQVATLGDAAAKLSTASGWNAATASSSNPAAVGVTAAAGTQATSVSLEVQQLAKAQSAASVAVPTGSAMGSGTLTIELGSWAGGSFAAGGATAVNVTIEAGQDSLSAIAAKINEAGAGVSATVLRDASGERLLLRSSETGEANGFRVSVVDADPADGNDLGRLAFNPGSGSGMGQTQAGQNALATVNGVAISTASNRLTDTLPGLTLQLSQVTTAPVEIEVKTDLDAAKKAIQGFVDAYNTLSTTLATATRYDESSKTAGALQGDSTAVGLQNALQSMMRSVTASTPFERLSDVGIEVKSGGRLEIKASKLDEALSNFEGVKALFTTTSTDQTARGFGLKVKAFADGLLAAEGLMDNKTNALQASIKRNGVEQERVNERAARFEVRLLAQYNAMDANVGRLNGLGAFVSQQIAIWNKSR
ncbi:MAG: flagellar filament capping protein FliD [Hydrogenophaga sp.]|jgi:flagellar hook-associated protein 2|nr:flagellar filament capping protein FliD [Hydrogenophaga sp.]